MSYLTANDEVKAFVDLIRRGDGVALSELFLHEKHFVFHNRSHRFKPTNVTCESSKEVNLGVRLPQFLLLDDGPELNTIDLQKFSARRRSGSS